MLTFVSDLLIFIQSVEIPGKTSFSRFLQSLYLLKPHYSTFDSKLMFIVECNTNISISNRKAFW